MTLQETHASSVLTPPDTDRRIAEQTYGHLRSMLVFISAFMLLGFLLLAVTSRIVEGSISAYYLGPIRDVFVGCMFAAAACLAAYHGRTRYEDQVLNVAAFLAVVVALVPTGLDETLRSLAAAPALDALTGNPRADAINALRVSVAALLLVSAAFMVWSRRQRRHDDEEITRKASVGITVANVLGAGFAGFLAWRAFEGEEFAGAHSAAAVLLIVCLAAAVAAYAFPDKFHADPRAFDTRYRRAYAWIFWLMTVGGAACFLVLLGLQPDYKVLIVELWELFLFLAFWVIEWARLRRPAAV